MHHKWSRSSCSWQHPSFSLLLLPSIIKINHKTSQHDKAQLHLMPIHFSSNTLRLYKIAINPHPKSTLHKIHPNNYIRHTSHRITTTKTAIFYIYKRFFTCLMPFLNSWTTHYNHEK